MRRQLGSALLVAVVVTATAAPATSAAAPGAAEIMLTADFATGVETFTSTGAFCSSGTAQTSDLRIVGGNGGLTFHLVKNLVCSDGSGSLMISVDAATSLGRPWQDQGGWSVQGGTGQWAGASGGGNLVGAYVPGGVIDDYVGVIAR
ncbi:MAG TPA: hypothetical protein VGK17_22375 [Propionicimonas sp.]|jgi:hypothetical protein